MWRTVMRAVLSARAPGIILPTYTGGPVCAWSLVDLHLRPSYPGHRVIEASLFTGVGNAQAVELTLGTETL